MNPWITFFLAIVFVTILSPFRAFSTSRLTMKISGLTEEGKKRRLPDDSTSDEAMARRAMLDNVLEEEEQLTAEENSPNKDTTENIETIFKQKLQEVEKLKLKLQHLKDGGCFTSEDNCVKLLTLFESFEKSQMALRAAYQLRDSIISISYQQSIFPLGNDYYNKLDQTVQFHERNSHSSYIDLIEFMNEIRNAPVNQEHQKFIKNALIESEVEIQKLQAEMLKNCRLPITKTADISTLSKMTAENAEQEVTLHKEKVYKEQELASKTTTQITPEEANLGDAHELPLANSSTEAEIKNSSINPLLAQSFYHSLDEKAAKTDGARQTKDFDQGCMSPYSPDQNSNLTPQPSDFPAFAVERNETSALTTTINSSSQKNKKKKPLAAASSVKNLEKTNTNWEAEVQKKYPLNKFNLAEYNLHAFQERAAHLVKSLIDNLEYSFLFENLSARVGEEMRMLAKYDYTINGTENKHLLNLKEFLKTKINEDYYPNYLAEKIQLEKKNAEINAWRDQRAQEAEQKLLEELAAEEAAQQKKQKSTKKLKGVKK